MWTILALNKRPAGNHHYQEAYHCLWRTAKTPPRPTISTLSTSIWNRLRFVSFSKCARNFVLYRYREHPLKYQQLSTSRQRRNRGRKENFSRLQNPSQSPVASRQSTECGHRGAVRRNILGLRSQLVWQLNAGHAFSRFLTSKYHDGGLVVHEEVRCTGNRTRLRTVVRNLNDFKSWPRFMCPIKTLHSTVPRG